jgi:hypothetical protein
LGGGGMSVPGSTNGIHLVQSRLADLAAGSAVFPDTMLPGSSVGSAGLASSTTVVEEHSSMSLRRGLCGAATSQCLPLARTYGWEDGASAYSSCGTDFLSAVSTRLPKALAIDPGKKLTSIYGFATLRGLACIWAKYFV